MPVSYSTVASPKTPAMTFRIKEGASQYWFAVLVDNTGNALSKVEAKGPGGSYRAAHREDYNYWLIDSGIGSGPFSVRVTDVRGRSVTATGITMSPGKTQTSGVRLGGGGGVPEKTKVSPKPKPKPSLTPSATPDAVRDHRGEHRVAGGGRVAGHRRRRRPRQPLRLTPGVARLSACTWPVWLVKLGT